MRDPEHFQQQLEVLRRDYELIRLSDVTTAEDLRGKAVITFDDGYLDNLLVAKPMLDRCEAPATVFVSTGYVGANRDYWWGRAGTTRPRALGYLRCSISGP